MLIVSQLIPLTSSSDACGFPFREFTPILIESLTYCSCSAYEPADRPTPRAKPLPFCVRARTPHSHRLQNVSNSDVSPPCPSSSPDNARSENPRPTDASPMNPSSFSSACARSIPFAISANASGGT